jgi:hypothetical protein
MEGPGVSYRYILGPAATACHRSNEAMTDRAKAELEEDTAMKPRNLFLVAPAALLLLAAGTANAGQTITEAGTITCVNDKWDEKEVDKGHKLVNYAGRCVKIPNDPAAPKAVEDCVGNYEYMPDGSWKGAGTCTRTVAGGDKMYETWQESSDLKEYPYKHAGGTGKFERATGGGTYFYESLTDTLSGGTYKGTTVLP